jgi:RNA polymerase sigma-70 factor (ECF subfamily)
LVRAAAVNPSVESRQALATLCQTYWPPVYAFIRRNGYDREQSQDLTQGFFTQLLEKRFLVEADQQRGKFRSFLLTAVKHFLANEWDREHAPKQLRKVCSSVDGHCRCWNRRWQDCAQNLP